jgi:hypothetical protein
MSIFRLAYARLLADEGIQRRSALGTAGFSPPFSTKRPQSFASLAFRAYLAET